MAGEGTVLTGTAELVLLHGFTQTGRSWDAVRRRIGAERYRHTAPDLRGHGRASAVRPVSFAAVTEDLDRLVGTAATLAGYSMGGRIALHYALARPGRVARLVLVGASPGLDDPTERAERRAADEALADAIERTPLSRFAEEWGAQPLFDGQPEHVAAAAHAERMRNTPAGLAAALRGLGTGLMEPLWERLGELEIPVTLVVGERDTKFRAIAERMAARLPQPDLVIVEGAGHAAHLEQPDAVAAAIAGS